MLLGGKTLEASRAPASAHLPPSTRKAAETRSPSTIAARLEIQSLRTLTRKLSLFFLPEQPEGGVTCACIVGTSLHTNCILIAKSAPRRLIGTGRQAGSASNDGPWQCQQDEPATSIHEPATSIPLQLYFDHSSTSACNCGISVTIASTCSSYSLGSGLFLPVNEKDDKREAG